MKAIDFCKCLSKILTFLILRGTAYTSKNCHIYLSTYLFSVNLVLRLLLLAFLQHFLCFK
ncbi:hypothetical protein C0J52_05933 [Blattella germanica]|nr:hypothetical protein C0J52_05933 [Blattella germanica]